jgi:protein-tyrosine phosphatase
MIDLHSHVLPSLDDGASSLAASLSICRAAIADGTTVIAGTPHVRFDYPTRPEEMLAALAELRAATADLPIEVVGGGEIALEQLERGVEALRPFGLGGNPGYLLLETPHFDWPESLVPALVSLRRAGVVPVLAHPERTRVVQFAPGRVDEALAVGALIQVTAAAVDGRLGERQQAVALALIWGKKAHLIASDAHEPAIRAVGMTGAAAAVSDPELARWLTHDVPGAIVSGAPLPPRPGASARRLPRLLRRR